MVQFAAAIAVAAAVFTSVHGATPTTRDKADPCAVVAAVQSSAIRKTSLPMKGDLRYQVPLDAETAYQCITSVPIDSDHAEQFLNAAKQYSNSQTSLAYLKNPPAAYQQPAVDVMAEFDKMLDKVKGGEYSSQYDFDVDMYRLVSKTHEEHFNIDVGVLGLFSWQLDQSIVAVSSDGKALPEVFALSDIQDNANSPSPIVIFDGQSVFTWLQEYTVNYTQIGDIEPHADWNVLMANAPWQFGTSIGSYTYLPSHFSTTMIYRGSSLQGAFANGTTFEWTYTAGAVEALAASKLTSGQSIYDNYVLNTTSSDGAVASNSGDFSADGGRGTATLASRASSTTLAALDQVPFQSYPSPFVKEAAFGRAGGGVSGYIIEDGDTSIGVLSLPSFKEESAYSSGTTASDAVAEFIVTAQKAKVQKIVIDVQGNGGGSVPQGYDTFKRFFPNTKPSLTFRARAINEQNAVGKRNTYVSTNTDQTIGVVWQYNANFTTQPDGSFWGGWDNFFGPREVYGDSFTNTMQPDFTSPYAGYTGLGRNEYIAGYGNHTLLYDQPWKSSDIIILSDGQCGSTCAVFSELAKTDAGVKFVTVGGVPTYGPMQAVSGTRAGVVTDWKLLDTEASKVRSASSNELSDYNISQEEVDSLPPPISSLAYRLGSGRFNGLDQIRASAGDDPLQFTYQASDCRLFFTAEMIRDMTVLWKAAAKVAGGDYSMCVQGSTNAPGAKANGIVTESPGFSGQDVWDAVNTTKTLGSTSGETSTGDGTAAISKRVSKRGFSGGVMTFAAALMREK